MTYQERKKTLTLAPINYKVHVILSNDLRLARQGRDYILGSYDDSSGTRALHTAHPTDPISYIFLPFESDIGYVAHESFHAVWHMMEYIGARHENEIMAYYLGYIVRETVKFLARFGGEGFSTTP